MHRATALCESSDVAIKPNGSLLRNAQLSQDAHCFCALPCRALRRISMSDQQTTSNAKSISDLVSMTELDGMGAETGYEETETSTVRVSGYISLVIGLFSWTSIVNVGAIAVSLIAVLFGVIAIRPVKFGRASGLGAAKMGIFLGVMFTLCGFFLPIFKTRSLGAQAERFTRNYIEVVNEGHDFFGIELLKGYNNRYSPSMPLAEFYQEEKRKMMESSDRQPTTLEKYRSNSGNSMIVSEGPDARWELDRPIRIYHQFRIDRAEVVMVSKDSGRRLRLYLQYLIDKNDVGQWHIEVVQPYRERIVAESIL